MNKHPTLSEPQIDTGRPEKIRTYLDGLTLVWHLESKTRDIPHLDSFTNMKINISSPMIWTNEVNSMLRQQIEQDILNALKAITS